MKSLGLSCLGCNENEKLEPHHRPMFDDRAANVSSLSRVILMEQKKSTSIVVWCASALAVVSLMSFVWIRLRLGREDIAAWAILISGILSMIGWWRVWDDVRESRKAAGLPPPLPGMRPAVSGLAVIAVVSLIAGYGISYLYGDFQLSRDRLLATGRITDMKVEVAENERGSGSPYYEVYWSFRAQSGRIFEGNGSLPYSTKYNIGDALPIEYLPHDPEVNRIAGDEPRNKTRTLVAMILAAAYAIGVLVWIAKLTMQEVRDEIRESQSFKQQHQKPASSTSEVYDAGNRARKSGIWSAKQTRRSRMTGIQ